ncbi:Glucooligosaccharide oxidase [Xylariaceae sp. FL1272]|nr:Glucooligosaccharide oxidase [Xylariaceae sp. FL1272]
MDTPVAKAFEALKIKHKTPLDPDWSFFASTYNSRVPVAPKIIILPETAEQVSKAVVCASAHGLRVQARSGGHSYASHSSGGVDGAAVIDLRNFQDVVLSYNGIAAVGGGVRLGNLALACHQRGRALAHGTCPAVGIGGHFTHGGFGLSSRSWGLAMDQIIALDVVMADGAIVHASETENSDLFVGMRGAADSFGVAVQFYLRTQPEPNTIVKFSIDLPEATDSVENAMKSFLHVQSFAGHAPVDRRLGLVVFLAHQRFSVEGTFQGSLDTFACQILPELLKGFPSNGAMKVSMEQTDWITGLRLWSGDMELAISENYEEHHVFYAKSATIASPGVTEKELKPYFEYLLNEGAVAPVGYFISAQLYGGRDSQIAAGTKQDAFAHRDAMWVFQHYGFVDDKTTFPDEGMTFIQGLTQALGGYHGAYNNYADPSLSHDEAQQLYYGEKLEHLKDLKGRLDPHNVFSHPQSVQK